MDYSLGTWNVKTLNRPGALKALIQQLDKYNINIAAIQEVRWLGSGIMDLKAHTICYSGKKDGVKEFGVAFIIKKEIKGSILDFKPVNERICTLRIKTQFFNVTMINVHAPTEDKDIEVKEQFYQQLERVYDSIPGNDVKLILGDLNAKIGKEKEYGGTIGRDSLHEKSNENGKNLIDFAMSKNMIVSSTFFPHKGIHKRTWSSPDGVTFNQIDHVLIDKRFATNILDIRSMRGAECSTDHYLVRIKYRSKLIYNKVATNNKCVRYNMEMLKEESKKEIFKTKINENFKTDGRVEMEDMAEQVDLNWIKFKTDITKAAEEVIGFQGKRDKREWFDEECQEAINYKNKRYEEYIGRPTRIREEAYKDARRDADKICRRKKRVFLNNQLIQMEEDFKNNNSKKAFSQIKFLKNGFNPRTELIRDPNGNITGNKTNIMNIWKLYFEQILNPHKNFNLDLGNNVNYENEIMESGEEDGLEVPSIEEIEESLEGMRNGRAPGDDGITVEMMKAGGKEVILKLQALIKEIWLNEGIPKDWKKSIICPIYKKGDKLVCSNYRGICLLPTSYKVFTVILKRRLEKYSEKIIGEYQTGFRPGRSTTDNLFILRQITEKAWEYNIDLYMIFIDFKQAYDCIDRRKLEIILRSFGIPPKLVNLIKVTMTDTINQVKIQNELTDSFETKQGLKQGDGLAPLLFNLTLEYIIRQTTIDVNNTIAYKSSQIMAYADVVIVSRSMDAAKEVYKEIKTSAKIVELEINLNKTKAMIPAHRRWTQNNKIKTVNDEIEIRDEYLGSRFQNDGEVMK